MSITLSPECGIELIISHLFRMPSMDNGCSEPSTEVPPVTTHAHRHHHGAVSVGANCFEDNSPYLFRFLWVFSLTDTYV